MKNRLSVLVALLVAAICMPSPRAKATEDQEAALRAAETAFARTMADRDHAAFSSFLDEEAVFSGKNIYRGRKEVAEAWKPYFARENAPFAWEPEFVAVLDSGKIGTTSGPVIGPDGTRIGTFNSVWRLSPDGTWKIVFDRGCPPCECP